jgi:hypothetical protein
MPTRQVPLLTDSEIARLTVAAAKACDMDHRPFRKRDAEAVVEWAQKVRLEAGMFRLVLKGQILPVGLKDDGEIAFGLSDMDFSPAEASAYRAELEGLQDGWEYTLPVMFSLSGDDDLLVLLSEPEKASLQLSLRKGMEHYKCDDLEESRLLSWAAERRNDEALLVSMLVGDVIPIIRPTGYRLGFRGSDELSAWEEEKYRGKLRELRHE